MSLAWIKKLNFRMLKLKKSIFFFKWALWFVELVYFPVLLNIIQVFNVPIFDTEINNYSN
jgi:hypothetical protein